MTILKKGSKGTAVKELQKLLHLIEDGIFGLITEETVIEYQKEHGLKPDGIVGPATMASLMSHYTNLKKSKRNIKEIIVHCSATPEGKKYTVKDIRKWHKDQGWSDIGYHYVVYLDGTVADGRDVDKVGSHCSGFNAYSIGVCYIGGVAKDGKTTKDTRTNAQKLALMDLLKQLKGLYPNATICGHRDHTNKKDCPSFDAKNEYKNI